MTVDIMCSLLFAGTSLAMARNDKQELKQVYPYETITKNKYET
jgi:hypothetical protein